MWSRVRRALGDILDLLFVAALSGLNVKPATVNSNIVSNVFNVSISHVCYFMYKY